MIYDEKEKIKSMIQLHYSSKTLDIDKTEIAIEDGVVDIKLDDLARYDQRSYLDVTMARFKIAKDVWDNIEDIKKVNFVDSFEKNEPEENNDEDTESVESEE